MALDRQTFLREIHDPLYELIVWNAPDHEHTRYQVRAWVEEALTEAFAVYETFGGDAAQGLVTASGPVSVAPGKREPAA